MEKLVVALLWAALSATSANAGAIVGGSTLVSADYLAQLEAWLGEGEFTLTNIFTKQDSSTAYDFHNAVNGRGRTFTVMGVVEEGVSATIGGYNPQSWSATFGSTITYDLAERTAFIYNLTSGKVYHQLHDDRGIYQTFNSSGYGPTFGMGEDIHVDNTLDRGYSQLYSYSTVEAFTSMVSGTQYNGYDMVVGALEVFTISEYTAPQTDIPEPATLGLLGLGVIGLAARRKRCA